MSDSFSEAALPLSGNTFVNHGNITHTRISESSFLTVNHLLMLLSLQLVSVQRLHKTAFTIQTSGPDRPCLFSTSQKFQPDIPWLPSTCQDYKNDRWHHSWQMTSLMTHIWQERTFQCSSWSKVMFIMVPNEEHKHKNIMCQIKLICFV